jgi:hypothetical protein
MTPRQFETLLERCGPDLARWPAAERQQAEALLAGDAGAAAALADALALDALLRQTAPAGASPRLREAVLALPLQHLRPARAASWPARAAAAFAASWRNWTAGLATAAAAMALGFVLGLNGTAEIAFADGQQALQQAEGVELGSVVLAEGSDILP